MARSGAGCWVSGVHGLSGRQESECAVTNVTSLYGRWDAIL
jgi:hypothetical protein